MRTLTLGLIGVALFIAACASATPAANTTVPDVVVSEDFHPSDAALLGATGRPQLVEFFAFW